MKTLTCDNTFDVKSMETGNLVGQLKQLLLVNLERCVERGCLAAPRGLSLASSLVASQTTKSRMATVFSFVTLRYQRSTSRPREGTLESSSFGNTILENF